MPLWNLLMWRNANAVGAVVAAWLGMALAVATWLIVTAGLYGKITVDNLGQNEPMLAGNVVALAAGGAIHVVLSLIWPQNYDWKSMGEIAMLENDQRGLDPADYKDELLDEALSWIQRWGWGFTLVMVILWPVLSLPAGVFDRGYFSFWVFVSLVWGFAASAVIIWLPIHESWETTKGIAYYFTGLKMFAPAAKDEDLKASPGKVEEGSVEEARA